VSPTIERKCIKCGRRVRVKLDRSGLGRSSTMHSQGRGRPRAASIKEMPRHLPREALKKILKEFNRWEARGRKKLNKLKGYDEGFVPASSVVDDLDGKEMGKRFRDPSYWKEILD